jgi:nucleotide-binding universal stress UspA family protein
MAAPVFSAPAAAGLKNVLFTTDFSDESLKALPFAGCITRAFRSRLHLLHIEAAAPLTAGLSDTRLYETAGRNAAAQLSSLRNSPAIQGLDPALVLAEGDIKAQLLKTIGDRRIDLVIAGTRGRTGVRKMLLGSALEEMCRASTCPILTVGPEAVFHPEAPFQRILFPTNLSEESRKAVPYIAMLAAEFGSRVTVLKVLSENEATKSDLSSVINSTRAKMTEMFGPELGKFGIEYQVSFGATAEAVLHLARLKGAGLIAMAIRNAFRPGILRQRTAYQIMAGAPCPVLTVP